MIATLYNLEVQSVGAIDVGDAEPDVILFAGRAFVRLYGESESYVQQSSLSVNAVDSGMPRFSASFDSTERGTLRRRWSNNG